MYAAIHQCPHPQDMFLGLYEEFGVQLLLHQRIEELDQSRVDRLGSLRIPLLHQTTELILQMLEMCVYNISGSRSHRITKYGNT